MSKRKHESEGVEPADVKGHRRLKKHKKNNSIAMDGNHMNASTKMDTQPDTSHLDLENARFDPSAANKIAKMGKRKGKRSIRKTEREETQGEKTALVTKEGQGKLEESIRSGDVGKSMSRKSARHHMDSDSSAWKISSAVGGRMLDLDPIFSQDEECLILAYDTAIKIYSTSTSLLMRRLQNKKPGIITAFTLSSTNPNHLYVSTFSGSIDKWDWTEGVKLGRWDISSQIYSLATVQAVSNDSDDGILYTIDKKQQWMITAHRLKGGVNAENTELQTLLKHPEPLTSVKILDDGNIVVTTSRSRMMIGYCDKPSSSPLRDLSYVWRELDCLEWITSIDVRVKPSEANTTRVKTQPVVDVVIGDLKGSIFIYEDLLGKLIRKEHHRKPTNVETIAPRRMHWHRNGVLTLKWSTDGNYVVSGGLETVLVLWQLETGHKQSLPHLSAPVESIVVSPSGSSYAIRLGDNSAMILSTAELQPTVSISGIQVPAVRKPLMPLPHIATVDSPLQSSTPPQLIRTPTALSSSNPGHLLFAVPSSSSSRISPTTYQSAAYLQSFDISSAHQISRQALTRTKTTTLNMGPESNTIQEPHVTHIQFSQDAQWLATLDEWMPPKRDTRHLLCNNETPTKDQPGRLEVYLKFWSWNSEINVWELVSRIDNPHSVQLDSSHGIGRVFDLISDPSLVGFATIGDDGMARLWEPSARRRDGIEVRAKDSRVLTTWKCRHASPMPVPESRKQENDEHSGAKIAYSPDGSIIAAGYQSLSPSTIHIIQTEDGKIRYTRNGLYTGPLLGLGILGKYLVILSHELSVWDLVNGQLCYSFVPNFHGLSRTRQATTTHLAVDILRNTFAIALSEILCPSKYITKSRSQIMVFDPAYPTPLYTTTLPNTINALLPTADRKGYYVVDSAAEVRILTPSTPSHIRSTVSKNGIEKEAEKSASNGLQNIYGNGKIDEPNSDNTDTKSGRLPLELSSLGNIPSIEEDDPVIVRPEQLAEIFGISPPFALPPMISLFEQVASLYSKKVDL